MNTGQLGRWGILAGVVVVFGFIASPILCAQESPRKGLRVGDIEGTWYGWSRGNGLRMMVRKYPDRMTVTIDAANEAGRPVDATDMTPVIDGDSFRLEGDGMTGLFHLEGRLLYGTFTHGDEFTSVAFARSMPDVERIFETQIAESEQRGQSRSGMRGGSENNLRQLGIILKMFANENRGELFPRLDPRPGHLMMAGSEVFPEYVTDVSVYISPAHPEAEKLKERVAQDPVSVIDDHSYWYLNFVVTDDETGLAFVEEYKAAAAKGQVPNENLEVAGIGTIPRSRENVVRFFITDINNPSSNTVMERQIPVLIERPELQDGGSCVLFMDGHTEFIEYPGRFPMTEKFIQALQSLDELKRQGPSPTG